jgi:lysyl endopeptidase
MLLTKRLSLYFIGLFISVTSSAQIDRSLIPLGFSLSETELRDIPFQSYSLPLLQPTASNAKHSAYPRMGTCVAADIDLNIQSIKTQIGGKTCFLFKIRIAGAKGLVPYFDQFRLSQGSVIHVYSSDKTEWIGAFNSANNTDNGYNTLGLFIGEEMIIEYVPGENASFDELHLNEIGVAQQFVPSKRRSTPEFGSAQNCEVNVNCAEGDNWRNQQRAVARILVKTGSEFGWCSGTMINNTGNDCTPFLLTADHCGIKSNGGYASNNDFNQWTFYFNYESADCSNPNSDSALVDDFLVGSSRIAYSQDQGGDKGSDFLLVKLKQRPDSLYNTFYAGWNAENIAPDSGIGIHHPSADIKKISTFTTPASSTTWGGIVNNTHWKVTWRQTTSGWGITEEGSSGSAIFNPQQQIVGTLTGGNSYCNTPTAPDDYGKFSYHWNSNGSTFQKQLQPWLDSLGTGLTQMDGRDKCITGIPNAIVPIRNSNIVFQLYPNPTQGNCYIQSNAKIQHVFVYDLTGKLVGEGEHSGQYFFDYLTSGVYTIRVIAPEKIYIQKLIVAK